MNASMRYVRVLILIVLLMVVAMLCACSNATQTVEAEAVPEITATPEIIQMEMVVEETVTPSPIPVPTPTPEPTPSTTEVPFSHYAPTVAMSYEELVGSMEDLNKKSKEILEGYPDPKTYYIIVDKQWQVVLVYKRIDDGSKFGKPDYDQPVRYMLCSSGNPDREYGHDTTSGIWQIEVPKERFWQFVNMEAAQYLTLIHSRTYFHSVLYKKKGDLNSLVPSSYTDLGKKASHACIRLTVPDSRWIYYNIGYGTTCEIRDGSASDETTGAIRAQLILPSPDSGIRLKARNDLWTDNWTIEGVDHTLPYKYQSPPIPDMGDGADEDVAPTATPGTGGATADPGASTAAPTAVPADTATPAPAATPDPFGNVTF